MINKSPIPTDKLTVVIIEETESRESLSSSQLNAISSQVWRDYVDEQGGQWRVLDPHTDISKEAQWVKDCMLSFSSESNSLPWLIVANKDNGYSGPFPSDLEEFMGVIKK